MYMMCSLDNELEYIQLIVCAFSPEYANLQWL